VVEVVDRRVAAMTYVGHAICASVAPSQLESLWAVTTTARRPRAPCADEH
jgi:hypothetical protein